MRFIPARLRFAVAMFLERAGLRFYTRTQTYSVSYVVKLENSSAIEKRIAIILPYPMVTPTQEVIGDVSCSEKISVSVDERYGNRYGVVRLDLKPGERREVSLRYAFRVRPQRVAGGQNLAFDAYPPTEKGDVFLSGNRCVQPEMPEIQDIAKRLRGKGGDVMGTIREINSYVMSRLTYGNPIPGLYSTSQALTQGQVDCGGFDTLYCALAMAAGIPSRVVSGFWVGYPKNEMHAWAESRIPDGSWIPVDPSVEQLRRAGRTEKSGRLGYVGSDRISLSVQCEVPVIVDGKTISVELLQHPTIVSGDGDALDGVTSELSFHATRV